MKNLSQLRIRKVGQSEYPVSRCAWANTSSSRFWGLLGQNGVAENEGLLLDPCNQVHMFFMRFPIDAVFLGRDDEILAIQSLRPWRLSKLHFRARRVLEVPYRAAERWGWQKGDRLELQLQEKGELDHA